MSIRFENVSKSFGTGDQAKTVLHDVSFEVQTGEIIFILGKSGVGKSVTLKHIIGMIKPDSGRIQVDHFDVTKLFDSPDSEFGFPLLRRRCGMVFQHPALLDSLTVFENIAFGLRNRPEFSEAEIRRIVHEKMELVHLEEEILKLFPSDISYGMQKRVSIARTLAPAPSYLLFDEPTTGLDPISTNQINNLILELSRALKVTSVVVSHDMGCALRIADRILVLDQSRILALGNVDEIKKSEEPLIRDFLAETLGDDFTNPPRSR
jgi:phospholipid/cholesterol/gamma-HCH transport system ATP-binding protein